MVTTEDNNVEHHYIINENLKLTLELFEKKKLMEYIGVYDEIIDTLLGGLCVGEKKEEVFQYLLKKYEEKKIKHNKLIISKVLLMKLNRLYEEKEKEEEDEEKEEEKEEE